MRAGYPPQAEEHAEPDAYRVGYEYGSEGRVREDVAA
jgi:hypothetical protein